MSLVFGPWMGEFGWELARWNPACRWIAEQHPNEKKYAIGPRGHGVIYEFVDEYYDFDEDFKYYPNMQSAAYDDKKFDKYIKLMKSLGKQVSPAIVGFNRKFELSAIRFNGTKKDLIHKLVEGRSLICLFPRQRSHMSNRNWPIEKWVNVAKHYCRRGYHVMAFGGPEDNALPFKHKYYTDFIGYRESDELNIAISALNLCKLSIAIQSGGIYLGLYAANKSLSFGLKMHVNRLKSENHLHSRYEYVVVDNYKFGPQFMIAKAAKYLNEE